MKRGKTILMLPDDLLLNCLARVSRLHYPTFSLVSKKFRSLLASTELYQTRTLLGRTETCLYVALRLHNDFTPLRWFTLCRVPNSSRIFLVPVSSPNSPSASCSDVAVVVGPHIYTIGGSVMAKGHNNPSSCITAMDCRSHTWLESPSMRVARVLQSACVHDGKIYVTGGSNNLDLTNWMEVFDTKTQTWEFLQISSEKVFKGSEYKTVGGYHGTVYVRSKDKNATYKLHKGRWREADLALNYGWKDSISHCVIDNVLYRYTMRIIEWYDCEDRVWKTLEGLGRLPDLSPFLITLVDFGGKLVVLWEEGLPLKMPLKKHIGCMRIAIFKLEGRHICGMVEFIDLLSTIDAGYSLVQALACTI